MYRTVAFCIASLQLAAMLGLTSHSLASESILSTSPGAFVSTIMAIAKHGDLADTTFVQKVFDVTFERVQADRPDLGVIADRFVPKSNLSFLLAPEIFYYRVANFSKPSPRRKTAATLQFSLNPKALCVRREHLESIFGHGEPIIKTLVQRKGPLHETNFKGSSYHFNAKNNLNVSFYFGGRFCLGAISIMQNSK